METLEPNVYLKIEQGSGNNSCVCSNEVRPRAALAAHSSKKSTMTLGGGPIKAEVPAGGIFSSH